MDRKSDNPSNVVYLPCETTLDIPPDRVLEGAIGQTEQVVVIGVDNGKLYFASSYGDVTKTLWLLKKAEKVLLETE